LLLVFIASVLVSIAIVGLLLDDDGEVAARDESWRSLSSTIRATGTWTPTWQIHFPLVPRDFPLVVQVPEGQYLFVEYWTRSVLGADCPGLCIDFPTYYFDPQSGELAVYVPLSALDDDDVGYVGSGHSLGGMGCGASSGLTKIRWCPFPQDDITLRYVDETGTITLERESKVIVLGAGEAWVSDEEPETWDWLGTKCVVTSTHYIANYAFQDRNKIVYTGP
jgi:hypothetical protein